MVGQSQIEPQERGGGALRLSRAIALSGTVVAMTAVMFDEGVVKSVAALARFVFAGVLLLSTLALRPVCSLRSRPRSLVKTLLNSLWVLVAVSLCLSPLSVDPVETVLQASLLGLMVAVLHACVTRYWNSVARIARDFRIIYWSLVSVVLLGLVGGGSGEGRLSGLFQNPNGLGLVSTLALVMGLGVWRSDRKLRYGGSLLAVGIALVATQSRTALISLLVAGVFLGVLRGRRVVSPRVVGVFLAVSVIGILLFWSGIEIPVPEAFRRLTETSADDPFSARDAGWRHAIELWIQRPVQGYGFRAGEVAFQQSRESTTFTGDAAHNSYLQLLLEVGIIGYLPFMVTLLCIIGIVVKVPVRGVGLAVIGVAAVALASSFTESSLFGAGSVIAWVIWIVIAGGGSVLECRRLADERKTRP